MTDNDKGKKSILFNATKKETHHPNSGFKKLFRRLKSNFKISSNKDEVSRDRLADADLLVFGGPSEPFTTTEFEELKSYLHNGGRALVMMSDGGEKQSGTNMNYLLEEFGMSVNADSVLRSVYYKYVHPKEVFISDGVLVPDILRKKNTVTLGGARKQSANRNTPAIPPATGAAAGSATMPKMPFVYPYGASLSVERPARPLLSSGPVSYPLNRPIAAMWEAESALPPNNHSNGNSSSHPAAKGRGRLVVLGSVEVFGDDWLDKEENAKLCDVLFSWLLDETELDMTSDRQDSDLQEFTPVPHVEALSQSLKPCLQGMEELPRDFTKMFDLDMFRFDVALIPQAKAMYDTLGVPHEPLTLIPPQFECPLPKLAPATFPPAMREPPPPALDQFDLDEHFAKEVRYKHTLRTAHVVCGHFSNSFQLVPTLSNSHPLCNHVVLFCLLIVPHLSFLSHYLSHYLSCWC